MSKVSYTPGPWLVHSTARIIVPATDAFIAAKTENGAVVDADEMPRSICLLRTPDEDFSEDETLANGFLIAAAPELLEAWEEYFDATERLLELEQNSDTTKRFDQALRDQEFAEDKARAAIAKARGDA